MKFRLLAAGFAVLAAFATSAAARADWVPTNNVEIVIGSAFADEIFGGPKAQTLIEKKASVCASVRRPSSR